MLDMLEQMNGLLTAAIFLIGGALVIFIYDAYKQTEDKNLLILALGLFILIIAGNIPSLAYLLASGEIEMIKAITISQYTQVFGILVILYSALRA
ncbi:MAG TPA: hypothetical protein ENG09_05400 [Candidatus Syntrophoarchaeum butanivorans]|uniref:Membrane protein n=1 Tax=Candidatus Syntropharchaeum butanivorans TaxID=1839936 RepID=A0A1F2P691_9EURY|nr:MAG: membrane protein [Candidatus Syntrophoarchaeum butanivorans]RJS71109.1 MAG: hypothetical protein CW694_05920 [Candidatus Syntrophoarchaeum sp. WYZ-LMO15]HDM36665.1 hypothetical protein [Candidatus Syntrophoarchaeum butanivorans]HEC56375.1 hypothetical protein [Candidatus Syntrophoarchaeum butanivorans]